MSSYGSVGTGARAMNGFAHNFGIIGGVQLSAGRGLVTPARRCRRPVLEAECSPILPVRPATIEPKSVAAVAESFDHTVAFSRTKSIARANVHERLGSISSAIGAAATTTFRRRRRDQSKRITIVRWRVVRRPNAGRDRTILGARASSVSARNVAAASRLPRILSAKGRPAFVPRRARVPGFGVGPMGRSTHACSTSVNNVVAHSKTYHGRAAHTAQTVAMASQKSSGMARSPSHRSKPNSTRRWRRWGSSMSANGGSDVGLSTRISPARTPSSKQWGTFIIAIPLSTAMVRPVRFRCATPSAISDGSANSLRPGTVSFCFGNEISKRSVSAD